MLKEKILKEEMFARVLQEVEIIVNSRPITCIDSNRGNLEVLTPMHYLIGSANMDNEFSSCGKQNRKGLWRKIFGKN